MQAPIEKEYSGDDGKATTPRHSGDRDDEVLLTGATSPGVKRIEGIAANLTRADRYFLFVGVFLIAYTYSLDGTLRYVFQVCILLVGGISRAGDAD